jgi:hypothetical protein
MGQTADVTQLLANAWPERQMAKSQKSQVFFITAWYGNPIQAGRSPSRNNFGHQSDTSALKSRKG